MKILTKCLSTILLLTISLSVYASKYDSLALAQELVEKSNLNTYATQVAIDAMLSVTTIEEDEKDSMMEFIDAMKEVYAEDIQKELAEGLVKYYSDDELRTISNLFENPSISKTFKAYYETFLSGDNEHKEELQRFEKNVQSLKDNIDGKKRGFPNYVKHIHYGKKYSDDNLLKMLRLMDGLKGNSIVAYDKWAQDKKTQYLSLIKDMHPELKRYPNHLDKLYDATFDTFRIYWRLKDNQTVSENDFRITASQLESNESFRRFFIEIYSIPKALNESIMKKYKLMKKLEESATKKQRSSDKNSFPKTPTTTYQI